MILLTRPEQKLAKSVAAFRQAGIAVTGIAPLTITTNADEIARCQQHFSQSPPDIAIVTSTFAAQNLQNAGAFRSNTLWLSVGISTASMLKSRGFDVVVPDQQSSEGLLQLPQLNGANCRQIVIIKGEGGRTTLSDTLMARGNQVDEYHFYAREPLLPPLQTSTWQWAEISGIVATSGEMAQQLFQLYDKQQLMQQRWLTVSERIADTLTASGVSNIAVCHDASDNALCAWIKDNWE